MNVFQFMLEGLTLIATLQLRKKRLNIPYAISIEISERPNALYYKYARTFRL